MVVGTQTVVRTKGIWYVYPWFKHVSFSVIAQKHIEELNKYFWIERVDELAFPLIDIRTNPIVLLHPFFYPFQKFGRKISRNKDKTRAILGVDVADSDHLSDFAVNYANQANGHVVPSDFSKRAFVSSGVKVPVYVVPHGLDDKWFEEQRKKTVTFYDLMMLKERRNLKLILAWILHSPLRKGLDILLHVYAKLLKEYNDVLLVIKTMRGVGYFLESVEKVGGVLEHHMDGKVFMGWLDDDQKMELYDVCDLFVLSSRGGAFEHSGLEAIARGLPIVAARGGSWQEYLPEWSLIPSKRSGQVLPDNPIHDGCGVEMDVDKAVDRCVEMLENLEEYRAKVKEHVYTRVKNEFTWKNTGLKLRDVILRHL